MSDKMLAIVKPDATIETVIGGQKFVVKVMSWGSSLDYAKQFEELMTKGEAKDDKIMVDLDKLVALASSQITDIPGWNGTVDEFLRYGLRSPGDVTTIIAGIMEAQKPTEDESKNSVSSPDGRPSSSPAGQSSDTEATVG